MNKISEFSKWLVVSDIDGTLIDKLHRLPARNIEAITDFVKKGGNFTLSKEYGDFAGGLIMKRGNIEANCTVELLIELCKADLSADVAKVLFS